MWFRIYHDYPPDRPLIKYTVEPGKGIIGCEMHELNGWGTERHKPRKARKKGFWTTLLSLFEKRDASHG
jgi:hypothetical protein